MIAWEYSHSEDISIHSFECFCNSLLRELPQHLVIYHPSLKKIEIKNNDQQTLTLALNFYSVLGRHQYQLSDTALLEQEKISNASAINWLIELACQTLPGASSERKDEFTARVFASDQNIKRILNATGPRLAQFLTDHNVDFSQSESALFSGHTFHPYPKNRSGLVSDHFELYSPEFAQGFALAWLVADAKYVHEQSAKHFHNDWISELVDAEVTDLDLKEKLQRALKAGKKVSPVHPWQLPHLQKNSKLQNLIKNGELKFFTQAPGPKWFATSSVRSIYRPSSPYMLKFSLSMRLTNSIRHLQPLEVVRGMQVHDVFQTTVGQELLRKWPHFHIMHEPAFCALKDEAGHIVVESIVVCRENPFTESLSQNKILLAALNQRGPNGERPFLSKLISGPTAAQRWFERYLEVVISPLIDAQANYGIYLGAHQQNIVLGLDESGLPKELYFRDCQGTGYSEHGLSLFGPSCASLVRDNGNILPPQMGSILFSYYLIINSTFNTITSLAQISDTSEDNWIQQLRQHLVSTLNAKVADESTIRYLLESKELWQKGNFGCCLRDINENTIENPMNIYNPIANPLLRAE